MEETHPFARLLAALFDISVFFLPFDIMWILWDTALYLRCTSEYMGVLYALVQTFTALPLIALCLSFFRDTPGKALLGFVVVRDCSEPAGFTDWYKRTVDSFWRGLGGMRTMLMIATLFFANRKLLMTGQTYWDSHCKTMVRHRGFKTPKTVVFICVFLLAEFIKYTLLIEKVLIENIT